MGTCADCPQSAATRSQYAVEEDSGEGFTNDELLYGYTVWMAGGGVKKGFSFGATDEFGCSAVGNRVHVHDMNATIRHLMGLNHGKLTCRFSGRDYRLTDVHGHVVPDINA